MTDKTEIRVYLENLITKKGRDINEEITLDGVYGLTWVELLDFIDGMPAYHADIRRTLVMIDFKNGDVFHYLTHLAEGMVKALGY